VLPDGIEYFAGDLTEEENQVVYATANPQLQLCSTRRSKIRPGGTSRAGTSWGRRIAAFTPISKERPRSA
jgi:hypothetical protein